MKHRTSFIIPVAVSIIAVGLTMWMWYFKIQLGLHRYFDIDELAYLYWATHIHMGLKPYIDFLFYPAPGFFTLLVPVVTFVQGIAVFTAARSGMLVVFALLSASTMLLFWETRKSWIALFIPLFLVSLPLPSDKFIEIRPDTLSVTLFLFGLWLQMRMMNGKKNSSFLAGLLYGLSIAVSQKMVLPVGIALFGSLFRREAKGMIGGMCTIGIITLLYVCSLGNFSHVWYSLTTLSFEASSLGKLFPISPQFFFRENDVIYGTGGYHIGYWLNLVLWTIGLCIGSIRLFTQPMLSILFLTSFLTFGYMLPMKHAQYLIFPAVFVVFFVVDGMWDVWERAKKTIVGQTIFFIGCCIIFFFFYKGYMLVTMPKLYWTNESDIQKAENIWNTIPFSEPVFDMVGLTMRYPQPYIAPVYPIGQMAPLISYPLPSLIDALEKTDTKYIYSGAEGRFKTLSTADQEYVQLNFYKVGDGTLWVRNDMVY